MKTSLLPYMAQFKNEEFKISFELVCSRLEGEEFTVEDVQQAFDNAQSYISKLDVLRSDKGPHRLSQSIAERRNSRHESLLSIKGRVNYFLKSPIEDEREAAQLLNTWLKRFSENYSKPSINKQTEMVNNMYKDLSKSEAISSAIDKLGLLSAFDFVRSVTVSIQREQAVREEEKRAKILKADEVRRVAYDKMKMLWTTIETAIKLGKGDIDEHLEYFRIINFALADFKTLHLNSNTRRKNAALKAEEGNEKVDHENGEHIDTTCGSGENRSMFNFIPKNGIEENNDLWSQPAAMQSKAINGGAVHSIPVNSKLEQSTVVKPEIVDAAHQFRTNDSDRESQNENLGS